MLKKDENKKISFNPTNDYVFKRIFGHVGNEEITKGLLSAIMGEEIKDVKLDLRYNKITDISFLKNLTNLKDLLLGSNQISSLWPLEKLTNLGETYEKDSDGNDVYGRLDLSNNPLSDIRGTYVDELGEEHEYYNMRILANLNVNKNGNLGRLYLEGCSNITENGLNVLRDSSLSWMNKSGF